MLNELFGKVWGWVAGAAALVLAAAGLYLRGRSTGRADERQERDTAVAKQQTVARETVREVENETNSMDDAAVDADLSQWVRRDKTGGH